MVSNNTLFFFSLLFVGSRVGTKSEAPGEISGTSHIVTSHIHNKAPPCSVSLLPSDQPQPGVPQDHLQPLFFNSNVDYIYYGKIYGVSLI